MRRDRCRCARCRKHHPHGRGLTARHIISRADGGADIKENLVSLCVQCHDLIEGRGLNSVAAIIGFDELEAEENIPPDGLVIAAESEKPYIDPVAQLKIIRAKHSLIDEKYQRFDEDLAEAEEPPTPPPREKPKKKRRSSIEWTVYEDNKWPPVPTWESFTAYHEQ